MSLTDKLHESGCEERKYQGAPLTSAPDDPLGECVFSIP